MLVRLAGSCLGHLFHLSYIWEQLRQISRCQVVPLGQVMPGKSDGAISLATALRK